MFIYISRYKLTCLFMVMVGLHPDVTHYNSNILDTNMNKQNLHSLPSYRIQSNRWVSRENPVCQIRKCPARASEDVHNVAQRKCESVQKKK